MTSFDPVRAARETLRAAATATLSTLTEAGEPFGSFVSVATDVDGAPLLLVSRLAVHTRNLDRDGRCSLLLVAPGGEGGDPLAGARITLQGRAIRVGRDTPEHERLLGRFLARHPEAEGYAAFADFGLMRIELREGHLVAGFGRIHRVDASELLVPPDSAEAFRAAEAGVAGHMNEDHLDAVRLYATRLLGRPDGDWRVVAADPDGLDLSSGEEVVRLPFRSRQRQVMELRYELKALSELARA
ncbi:HugZ family protein [Chthonobacter rhizosphaerae]|uniref:HugZ family pyridoxamine 5'-phosphate oxidase n=1 Tax=Chthonobacter rhizosphaerae TaxID=2735553 RepID=UPI0015EF1359|nr:DUF2470 domain-containing protein [Chthonobacter rhizosphaerae]